ncbi:MAG: 2-oxoacid:acceptor oxidoreductase family protein [Nitrososphaeria archaeon]|nr:2-oxoacid:acceptor oxidoreductase family protein [Nitrososphaeria archaeon]
MLTEIRIHGRGGQGVVACGELIALAAHFDNKFCRAFPLYGAQRRGAPLTSFVSIGDEKYSTRSQILSPDYVIILDIFLPRSVNVLNGLREGGTIVYNTNMNIEEAYDFLGKPKIGRLAVVDASKIAVNIIGKPIPSTVMAASFAKVSELIKLDSIFESIRRRFTGLLVEKNILAAKIGYDNTIVKRMV